MIGHLQWTAVEKIMADCAGALIGFMAGPVRQHRSSAVNIHQARLSERSTLM